MGNQNGRQIPAEPALHPPAQVQPQLNFPQGIDVRPMPPVRDFRPRRQIYSRAQKERAVRLLNMGIPCRQVARMIGPRCSSGTPIRWRQIARRQQEARRRLEQMMRDRH